MSRREGWEKRYSPIVALKQHLHNTCRAAKVAIYLERRMRAEEVGICTSAMFAPDNSGLEE